NLAVWVLLQGAGAPRVLAASVYLFGSVPCEITGACATQGIGHLSVLTSIFMHGGWEHLIGNMVFLWVFGNNVEDSLGHFRFIAFFLRRGTASAAAHILLAPPSQVPTVGSSGALSGIMGADVLLYPRARLHAWVPPLFMLRSPAWFFLGHWF